MSVDRERLAALFADPALDWILERLRQRLERGAPLTGHIALAHPSHAQHSAINRLLGRSAPPTKRLRLSLSSLEQRLQHAGIADDLRSVITALSGPVIDKRAARTRLDQRWNRLFAELTADRQRVAVREWLDERRTRLLTRRFARHETGRGRLLLEQALLVIDRLPAPGMPLAELAATVTGDSHALDAGRPLATLVIAAAARLGAIPDWHGAAARRDVWASVGVLLDELSAPVLVLNLPATGPSLTARALRLHAEAGEPYRLTARQLLRHPPTFVELRRVYVCENPAVVATAAHRLGAASAPLICLEGPPATAARLLLGRLHASGSELAYHGDFDWGGLRIANLVVERHGAVPWRFATPDYLSTTGGKLLEGRPVEAIWDAELRSAMARAGRAVHEELVLDQLISDLVDQNH